MLTVSDAINAVTAFCNSLRKGFQFTLWLSFLLGKAIVEFFSFLFIHLWNAVIAVWTVLRVLYEDFIVFLMDGGTRLNKIASGVAYFWSQVLYVSYEICQVIHRAVLNFNHCVLSFLNDISIYLIKLYSFIVSAPQLLKEAIILIGSCIWNCIVLIPICVVCCVEIFVYGVSRCYEELKSIVHTFFVGICTLFFSLQEFLCDVPATSIFGLMVGAAIFAGIVKYKGQITTFGLTVVLNGINCIRYLPVRILQSILSAVGRALARPPPEIDSSSDETSSEGSSYSTQTQTAGNRFGQQSKPSSGIASGSRDYLQQPLHNRDSMLCVVCQDREKCIVILPCQHLCLCDKCAPTVYRENGKCPICRQPLRKAMKVYVS